MGAEQIKQVEQRDTVHNFRPPRSFNGQDSQSMLADCSPRPAGQHLEPWAMKKYEPDPNFRCDFRTLSTSEWAAVHDRFKLGSLKLAGQHLQVQAVEQGRGVRASMHNFGILRLFSSEDLGG